MKKRTATSALRRCAAAALALVLALPTAYAAAGEQKLQTVTTLVDGLTYFNTITDNQASRVESHSFRLENDSDVYPIILNGSGTVYGTATIHKAVSYAQELGYHVLGAVNADFFSTSSGVPLGIVIEDGIYKSSSGTESALAVIDGSVSLVEAPQVTMTLTNERDGAVTTPKAFNKLRTATGGLYLLNQDFSTVSTRTTTPGWYVRMTAEDSDNWLGIPVDAAERPPLTVNSTLELHVTEVLQSDQPLVIAPNEYILTADDADALLEVYQSFQVGDTVTLTTTCTNEALSAARWACGAGDVMIREGERTDSANWTYSKDGRAPRTALGVLKDGSLLLYTADGRQSGHSMGLTQLDLADELLAQGCEWAVNLDGGGSTALSAWLPGQPGVSLVSRPSDGKARSCANYILLVTDNAGDGYADRLALVEDGLTVLAGSSLPLPESVILDNGLNVLDRELTDLKVTSKMGLGKISNGVYTAGTTPGTDTLQLKSSNFGIKGTAQIHIVDSLTELTVTKEGEATTLSSITIKPEESVQLKVTGSYWGRPALREPSSVTWTVDGGVGSVDETGLFTASDQGGSGALTVTAGGLTQTFPVTMTNIHKDVTEEHWGHTAVEYCYQNGIVGGISATEFGRDQSIRRADFMLMLYNALGKPAPAASSTFTDVLPTDYYYTALSWAQGAGLASGTGEGTYSPNANITREQAFTILRQALPLLGKVCPDASLTVLDQFADRDTIAGYARPHAATLVAQGVVSGRGDGLDPRGNLTRVEMAALLYKLITYTPILDVPTDPVEPELPVTPEVPVQPEQPETPETPEQPELPDGPAQPEGPALPDPSDYTLTLDQTALSLDSAQSVPLAAVLTPAWEGAEITWSSSDPATAAVNPNGLVTNLHTGAGASVVAITASWNGLSASCEVFCMPADRTATVTNAELGLNVRSGPGREHSAIGNLKNEARVVVLNEQNGWYQVLYRNDRDLAAVGFVSGDYLTLTE